MTLFEAACAGGLLLGSLGLGWLVEWLVLRQLSRLAKLTRWEFDDILVSKLRGFVFPWFVLAGAGLSLSCLTLDPSIRSTVKLILEILLILLLTALAMRLLGSWVKHVTQKKSQNVPAASLLVNVTRIVVGVAGALVLLQSLGISITPALTALGVGGLAVALALQDTLGNLFSGIQILITQMIRPGDYIRLETGQEGYVHDITWRYTTLRSLPNTLIVVPNSKIASLLVTDFSLPEKEMAVLVEVGVAYESDLRQVETITCEVARDVMQNVTGGVAAFEPFIRYHTFGDFSIQFTVILRAREFVDQYLIKHEFIKRLHERYQASGIHIPFPIRDVRLRQLPSDEEGAPCRK
jgi:small-conductance mechanosensitive channel